MKMIIKYSNGQKSEIFCKDIESLKSEAERMEKMFKHNADIWFNSAIIFNDNEIVAKKECGKDWNGNWIPLENCLF